MPHRPPHPHLFPLGGSILGGGLLHPANPSPNPLSISRGSRPSLQGRACPFSPSVGRILHSTSGGDWTSGLGEVLSNSTPSFSASCPQQLEGLPQPLPGFPEHPLSFIFCSLGHSGPQGFWAWTELSQETCRKQGPLKPSRR